MSNKLDQVLQKDRKIYEEEKEKFLDALAEFIEKNNDTIKQFDRYFFAMNAVEKPDEVIFYFSSNMTNWPCYENISKPEGIHIKLSIKVIYDILRNEYKATISKYDDKTSGFYTKIILPFV